MTDTLTLRWAGKELVFERFMPEAESIKHLTAYRCGAIGINQYVSHDNGVRSLQWFAALYGVKPSIDGGDGTTPQEALDELHALVVQQHDRARNVMATLGPFLTGEVGT